MVVSRKLDNPDTGTIAPGTVIISESLPEKSPHLIIDVVAAC